MYMRYVAPSMAVCVCDAPTSLCTVTNFLVFSSRDVVQVGVFILTVATHLLCGCCHSTQLVRSGLTHPPSVARWSIRELSHCGAVVGVNNIHCLGWTLAFNSIHRQRVYLLAGGVADRS